MVAQLASLSVTSYVDRPASILETVLGLPTERYGRCSMLEHSLLSLSLSLSRSPLKDAILKAFKIRSLLKRRTEAGNLDEKLHR